MQPKAPVKMAIVRSYLVLPSFPEFMSVICLCVVFSLLFFTWIYRSIHLLFIMVLLVCLLFWCVVSLPWFIHLPFLHELSFYFINYITVIIWKMLIISQYKSLYCSVFRWYTVQGAWVHLLTGTCFKLIVRDIHSFKVAYLKIN